MAYIDIDLDQFDDDDILEEAIVRLEAMQARTKGSEIAREKFIKLMTAIVKDIEIVTTGKLDPTVSILDEIKRDLLDSAFDAYTLDELESLLPKALVTKY